MPTTAVDFHLPLPWYLDIIPETNEMVDNAPMTDEQVALAEAIASLLAAALQQYGAQVLYPADRWSSWGTPAGRGLMRRFTLRMPEERLQEFARGARLVADQVIATGRATSSRAVVVTHAGDDTAILF